jgi:hypothetical protein
MQNRMEIAVLFASALGQADGNIVLQLRRWSFQPPSVAF